MLFLIALTTSLVYSQKTDCLVSKPNNSVLQKQNFPSSLNLLENQTHLSKSFSIEVDTLLIMSYYDYIFDSDAFLTIENTNEDKQFETMNIEKYQIGNKVFETFADSLLVLNYIDALFDNPDFTYSKPEKIIDKNQYIIIENIDVRCFQTDVDSVRMLNYISTVFDSKSFEDYIAYNLKNNNIFKIKIPKEEALYYHQVITNEFSNSAYVYLPYTLNSYKVARKYVEELNNFGIKDAEIVQINEYEYEPKKLSY